MKIIKSFTYIFVFVAFLISQDNYYLYFDGNDVVEIYSEINLNIFTIEATFITTYADAKIVSKHCDASYNSSWAMYVEAGVPSIYFTDDDTYTVIGVAGSTRVDDGNIHTVAGQYDGNTLKIFVDGVLEFSEETALIPKFTDLPIAIGAYRNNSNTGWSYSNPIYIDEVRISDAPLYPTD